MAISLETVDYVAALAKLRVEDEEKADYADKLNQILEYMDQLSELDTEGILPMTQVLATHNVFRSDEQKPSLDREKALANAPDHEGGYFRVPRIM